MSDERFLELVPLAALGALDGEERAAFEAAMASSPVLQRELAAYKETAGRIGVARVEVEGDGFGGRVHNRRSMRARLVLQARRKILSSDQGAGVARRGRRRSIASRASSGVLHHTAQ